MITRSITRPITSLIARGINAAFAVWNPRALFALGEQGVIYDPSDLSTLWQDSAGTTPVTAAGQPVGLMLDKSRGLVLGAELVTTPTVVGAPIGGPAFTDYVIGPTTAPGVTYEVSMTVSGYSGTGTVTLSGGSTQWAVNPSATAGMFAAGNGMLRFKVLCAAPAPLRVFTRSTNTCTFSNISVRELPGAHAFQPTASAKPFVRDTPRRIDYDADDSLGITFPVSLGAACTVARAIPGVGAQILTAQTIGTSFTDNVDNCGLIIINRALNAAETANLTRYLNQRAGV